MLFNKAYIESLMDYLASFSDPGFNPQERTNYLNFSLDRFLKTLELIPGDINSNSKILELGASPYFMSLIIKKNLKCHIDFANYFGMKQKLDQTEILFSKKYDEKHVMRFKHFNVEKDIFPYKDKSYDLVLFCEIIEHLTVDPVHSLVQISRILKKGGYVIITTPNVLRFENVLNLFLGRNIYDHYSGYGAYGRHNREYTPHELGLLVESLGFKIVKNYSRVTGSIKIEELSIKRLKRFIQLLTPKNRGGNIFLLAQKVSEASNVHPPWLFGSMHCTGK